MGLEDMAKKVEDIKEDLKKVKESVLSETKRIEQINYIKYRAEMAKRELESSFNSLKDKAREEGQSLLKSLNEVINFKLSI